MRILESRTKTVDDSLTLDTHAGMGYRIVYRSGCGLCDDGPDTQARATAFAMEAAPLAGKTVAWVGGGLCVGPRLFALTGCHQTVYEIEPALAEFCPLGVGFIPGDWQVTLSGTFDIIVYDLGSATPEEVTKLQSHCTRLLGANS